MLSKPKRFPAPPVAGDPWTSDEKLCFSFLTQTPSPSSLSFLLQIHAFLLRRHLLLSNLSLLSRLILSSPTTAYARRLFDFRSPLNPFLCNSMLRSLVSHRSFPDSVLLYRDLRRRSPPLHPDSYTFTFLLKSCASLDDPVAQREGPQIHSHVIKMCFCGDVFASTGLIDMYVKSGDLVCAKKVFDGMGARSLVTWTSMIVGFARGGEVEAALELFGRMPEKDVAVFNALVDLYVKSGDLDSARKLFDEMPDRNVVSWTSLLSGYCKAGDMEAARVLFDGMPEKNLYSWNVMIGGYCQNRQPYKAMELFRELQSGLSPFQPDKVTLVSIIPAIADMGAIELGRWIHNYVRRIGMEYVSDVLTSLVDMYAKCGVIDEAKRVFEGMYSRSIASWNAMINGLAVNGCAQEALDVFTEMQRCGICPNELTMMGVLSACNHGGLVEEGKQWFKEMEAYGIERRIEHYGCMVDLLGRRGHLEEAEQLVNQMPFNANEIILTSLLSACVSYEDIDRAERVIKTVAKLEPTDARNYVMLRNLYAGKRMWDDVERIKDVVRKYGGKKEAGCSVIEVGSRVSEFVSGDKLHPAWEVISSVIGDLHLHMKSEEEKWAFDMLVFWQSTMINSQVNSTLLWVI